MLNNRALLRAHVDALFTQSPTGRLIAVNEPGGKAAPRFFLGRTPQGSESWYRNDLPNDIVKGLTAACSMVASGMDLGEPAQFAVPFVALLEQTAPIQTIWSGPAFRFPDRMEPSASIVAINSANAAVLRPHLGAWYEDAARGETLYGVMVGGVAVAVCASVRRTAMADEAGVETAPEFRGQGYAAPAVCAWAAAVRSAGREPLYSTSWRNTAALALARKLGLVQFASDLHIT